MTTASELKAQIEALMETAESGEQWAEICLLEELMIEAEQAERESRREFPFSGSF